MAGILSILAQAAPIALGAGKQFLDSRAIDKANQANQQRVATSNLINLLSPRARHQPNLVQPRESGLSRALGAGATGFNIFNALNAAKQQNELIDLQRRGMEQNLEAGDLRNRATRSALGLELGQQLFNEADPQGRVPARVESFGKGTVRTEPVSVMETAPSSVRQGFTLGRLGQLARQQQAEDRFLDQLFRAAQLGIDVEQLGQGDRRLAILEANLDAQMSFREAQEAARKLALQTQQAQRDVDNQFKVVTEARKLPFVKGAVDIQDSFTRLHGVINNLAVKGFDDQAASELAVVNLFQRLIDPATVREGDVALAQSAQSTMERVNALIKRTSKGGFVDKSLLNSMGEAATALYGAWNRAATETAQTYMDNLAPGISEGVKTRAFNQLGIENILDRLGPFLPITGQASPAAHARGAFGVQAGPPGLNK